LLCLHTRQMIAPPTNSLPQLSHFIVCSVLDLVYSSRFRALIIE
jgi:hypothetical protein